MRSTVRLSSLGMLLALSACQPSTPIATEPALDKAPNASAATPAPSPPPASKAPAPEAKPTAAEHWQCGEILLDVRTDDDTVRLDFSGRSLTLPHVESLTGSRHADTAGNEFMRQGQTAELILAESEARDCSHSTQTSPWIDATSRGIGFRAVGSEPGWFVEVGRGDVPPLHATLDYGDRKVEVARMQVAGLGYNGQTADGVSVALKVQRTSCHDGMSGEAFEATAQLVVGDKSYRGCGAFLGD